MTHKLIIENISCDGCVSSITKALMEIEGVDEVKIDKPNVTVNSGLSVSREMLEKVLHKIGYPVSEKTSN